MQRDDSLPEIYGADPGTRPQSSLKPAAESGRTLLASRLRHFKLLRCARTFRPPKATYRAGRVQGLGLRNNSPEARVALKFDGELREALLKGSVRPGALAS